MTRRARVTEQELARAVRAADRSTVPRAVFRPADVAERWECSEKSVRNMIKDGRLKAFKIGGTLLRITLDAVEEFERCTGSSFTEGNGPSHGRTGRDVATDIRLARVAGQRQMKHSGDL